VSNKNVARLQALIWVLIYGGLLTLVLGLSVQRTGRRHRLVHGGRAASSRRWVLC
jgi:hypothetical protein